MFQRKIILATVTLCVLRNSVASTVLLFPDNNEVKESSNIIDDLATVFQNTDRTLGNESPADVLLKLILLIMDVFTTASGSYLIQPDANNFPSETEQQQVIAVASTNLWMKLPLTILMEEVFFNASQITLAPILQGASNRIENIHNDLFNNIEVQIKANSSLYKTYTREKHRVEELDLPAVASKGVIDFRNIVPIYAFQKLILMLNEFPRLQYFMVHAQFASYARGASLMSHLNATMQKRYYAVAQSIVLLASDTEIGQKVQEQYEKALRKTVETVKRQWRNGEDVLDADQILFPEIEKVFKWEPRVDAALSRMMEDLDKTNIQMAVAA